MKSTIKFLLIVIIIPYILFVGCKNRVDESFSQSTTLQSGLAIQVEWPEPPSHINAAPPDYLNIGTIEVLLVNKTHFNKYFQEHAYTENDVPDETNDLSTEEIRYILEDFKHSASYYESLQNNDEEPEFEFDYNYIFNKYDVKDGSDNRNGVKIENINTGEYYIYIAALDKTHYEQLNIFHIKQGLEFEDGKVTFLEIKSNDWIHTTFYNPITNVNEINRGNTTYETDDDELESFEAGTEIIFTANANSGYKLTNWAGDVEHIIEGTVEDNQIIVKLPMSDINLTANFEVDTEEIYTLNVNKSIDAAGDVTAPADYNAEEEITISTSVNAGYTFNGWTGDTAIIDEFLDNTFDTNSTTNTVKMPNQSIELTANYTINQYNVVLSADPAAGGIPSGAGTYDYNESVTINAGLNPGYTFLNWTGDTAHLDNPDNATTTITVPADNVTVQANFEVDSAQTFALSLNQLPSIEMGEAQDLTETQPYNVEDEVELLAVPNTLKEKYYSHLFDRWEGDTQYITTGSETTENITITMPASDISLTAIFKREVEVFVEAGSYTRGNTRGEGDSVEEPTHEVILTHNFYISKYEVTYELYDLSSLNRGTAEYGEGQRPVINVTWYEAIEFADWLSQQHGLEQVYGGGPYDNSATQNLDANGYRLPTEAEWEYAARGGHLNPHIPGDTSTDYLYAGSDNADDVGWHSGNSGSETKIVGQKLPNELGLFDMSGNVQEWVWDWNSAENNYSVYPGTGGATDPTGPSSGSSRIVRGGSWFLTNYNMRVSHRGGSGPGSVFNFFGMRLVRTCSD
ncbi:MAG: SUMF1/EgtB/PvdO family nonheme iron enzyme [Candidatus Muiribacteriota bacterium]